MNPDADDVKGCPTEGTSTRGKRPGQKLKYLNQEPAIIPIRLRYLSAREK